VFTSGDAFEVGVCGVAPNRSFRSKNPFFMKKLAAARVRSLNGVTDALTTRIGKQAPVPFTLHQERERQMKNMLARLWKEEEGQDLTEYALLLVLVALAAIGSLGTLATAINNTFSKAASNLNT
jgi:pilus assembly protein Flp/PilA